MSESIQNSGIVREAFEQMQGLFVEQSHPLFLRCDTDMRLQDWWGDEAFYGFSQFERGDEAGEHVDFLLGLEHGEPLDLPIVAAPNGHPVSIHIRPTATATLVLILDAKKEHDRQLEIQQKSNDVQLLSKRQEKLMAELRLAQIEIEKKRQEAETANQLKSEFISRMSHEFRTPLTAVLGYSELLERGAAENSEQRNQLVAISRGAKHLLSLVENLLDQGRLEEGEMVIQARVLDVPLLLADIASLFEPLATNKGLEFRIEHAELPGQVLVDDMRFRQILINLIGNAIKFTKQGSVTLRLSYDNGGFSCAIRDTGPGIPVESQERIFQAFQRATDGQEKGAGLGLAISRRLVQLLGGELALTQSDSNGSEFSFNVDAPLWTDDVQIDDTSPSEKRVADTSQRVLLAEDDDDIASLVELVLEGVGYDVVRARNGQEAIDKSAQQHFDIVLIDMNMPVVNGIDAIRAMRSRGFTAPVVALTASASAQYRIDALAVGCDRYLVKPVGTEMLVETVQELLNEHSGVSSV